MSEQDSVLLLRRIEQAIYGLEKRFLSITPSEPSNPTTEPPVINFPSTMSVEVEGGSINAVIEEQPIQTETQITTELSCAPVAVNLAAAGTVPILTAPSGTTRKIYHIALVNNGLAVATVRFQDNNSIPILYTGYMNVLPDTMLVLSHSYPFITVSDGVSLVLESTTPAVLGGYVLYREVGV